MNDIDLANRLKRLIKDNPGLVVASKDVAQLCEGIITLFSQVAATNDQLASLNREKNDIKRRIERAQDGERIARETWLVEKKDLEAKRKMLKTRLKDAGLKDDD